MKRPNRSLYLVCIFLVTSQTVRGDETRRVFRAGIGLELKDRSPFDDTFTIELASGSFGYLPTPEQHRLGGYETWLGTNFVEYEASRKIVKNVLEMFHELHETKLQ